MNNHCLNCDAQIITHITWKILFFSAEESPLCASCLGKLAPIHGPRCNICSRSFTNLSPEFIDDTLCRDCVRWETNSDWAGVLERNLSAFEYNDFLQTLIARYKFRGDYVLAKAFSSEVRTCINQMTFDILVPIPLSEERLKERGFNQALGLAQEAGFPAEDILIRQHSEKQSKKSRQARIQAKDIFKCSFTTDITGKKIVLIDDIYTTGSTLRHAAKVLKLAGAKSVSAFTLARG